MIGEISLQSSCVSGPETHDEIAPIRGIRLQKYVINRTYLKRNAVKSGNTHGKSGSKSSNLIHAVVTLNIKLSNVLNVRTSPVKVKKHSFD